MAVKGKITFWFIDISFAKRIIARRGLFAVFVVFLIVGYRHREPLLRSDLFGCCHPEGQRILTCLRPEFLIFLKKPDFNEEEGVFQDTNGSWKQAKIEV